MNKNIRDWACSLSGCNGGDIDASIWLCGIEWAGGSLGNYYTEDLPKEISKGASSCNMDRHNWEADISFTYGRSVAKLYTAIKGGKVEDYKQIVNESDNKLFRLNLYPIAFDSTDPELWQKYKLHELVGFQNKYLFNTWCFFNRSKVFRKFRIDHNPKLIIGTGIDYLHDFLMYFGDIDKVNEINQGEISGCGANKYTRSYYWIFIDEHTLLIVIPFFSGRYGLNSNYLIQEMGNKIRNLMKLN